MLVAKMGTAGRMAVVLAAGLLTAACAGKPEALPAPQTAAGPRIELRLEPGPRYTADRRILGLGYTVRPQVAVWMETREGEFVGTVYVTRAAADGSYRAAPKEGRPEALPVWSFRKSRGPDAVSSPTSAGASVAYTDIAARLPAGTYAVFLEANRSYDWNGTYTKKNSGVNGQPSVIYRADIEIGAGSREARFLPVGTGSVDGSDGEVHPGLDGIDTALELFASMVVRYVDD